MGGGTGTGAAPIVAQVAKDRGILTVAVVTRPFRFEGKRQRVADAGIEELKKCVDSLIVIPNDKLMQVLGEDVSVLDAYAAANDVLRSAVSGIAEVINNPGLVNVDFADVRTVMSEVGMAMMGSATAAGPDRARLAAERAVASPLLEEVNLSGARGVLVNITASSGLKMKEYHHVMETIKEFTADEALVIVGTVIDDSIGDELRVTMQRLKMPEGEPIEHTIVNRSIAKAQNRVESRNFDIRKQLLEYDDVANDQRRVIYQQRNELLETDDVSETIRNMRRSRTSDGPRRARRRAAARRLELGPAHRPGVRTFLPPARNHPAPEGPRLPARDRLPRPRRPDRSICSVRSRTAGSGSPLSSRRPYRIAGRGRCVVSWPDCRR